MDKIIIFEGYNDLILWKYNETQINTDRQQRMYPVLIYAGLTIILAGFFRGCLQFL